MNQQEMISGLKAGKTLMLDGAATPDERHAVQLLIEGDLVDVTFVEGDQYGAFKIKWKQAHPSRESVSA
jgi:hypothetical protein